MGFSIPTDAIEFLGTYKSTAHFRAQSDNRIKCEIKDTLMNQVWATGYGVNKEEALQAAVANAQPGEVPLTPAQIAAKNKELEAELAKLRGGNPAPASDETDNGVADDQLEQAMTDRGITPPIAVGNPRWKQAARKAIADHDAQLPA